MPFPSPGDLPDWVSLLTSVLGGKKYAKIEDTLMVYCDRNKTVPDGINIMTLTLYFKG